MSRLLVDDVTKTDASLTTLVTFTSITHILWRRWLRAAAGTMGRVAALVPCFAAIARGVSLRALALVGRVTLCRRRAKAQPDKRG